MKGTTTFKLKCFQRIRSFFCVLLMLCFFISTVSVPESDFTLMAQLPALYHHCMETEDKNMNFIDFITDHLINADGVFNTHDAGDGQKPHRPFAFGHLQHMVAYEPVYSNVNIAIPSFQHASIYLLRAACVHSDYISYMFHPPDPTCHHTTLYL